MQLRADCVLTACWLLHASVAAPLLPLAPAPLSLTALRQHGRSPRSSTTTTTHRYLYFVYTTGIMRFGIVVSIIMKHFGVIPQEWLKLIHIGFVSSVRRIIAPARWPFAVSPFPPRPRPRPGPRPGPRPDLSVSNLAVSLLLISALALSS